MDLVEKGVRPRVGPEQGIEHRDVELEPLDSVLARASMEIDPLADRTPRLENATTILLGDRGWRAALHDPKVQQSIVDIVDAFEPHLWPHASVVQKILNSRHARQPVDDGPIIGLTGPRPDSR